MKLIPSPSQVPHSCRGWRGFGGSCCPRQVLLQMLGWQVLSPGASGGGHIDQELPLSHWQLAGRKESKFSIDKCMYI